MRFFSVCLALVFFSASANLLLAQEKTKAVRMGCGLMTFDTVPGWGLRPDGQSAIGPTHGSVVIDKAGNIYTSANAVCSSFRQMEKSSNPIWVRTTRTFTT